MEMESLGDLAIHIVLSNLSASDVAAFGCVGPRFRVWASDDSLWSRFCSEELDLSSPLDPDGNPTPSFKEAYNIWRLTFGSYPWPLVKRVKRCWGTLKNWLDRNFPEATLQRGASESKISELESNFKVKLPLPTRLLYRFFDGQTMEGEEDTPGALGGYTFYSHSIDVCLLSLRHVIQETMDVAQDIKFSTRSKYIIVASSSTCIGKFFFLNCSNGKLYVGTKNLYTDGEMLPCVSNTSMSFANRLHQEDALLLWLEEHGRRLQYGDIRLRTENTYRRICLFPELPPFCSIAVTQGVQIRASAMFIPEITDLQDESDKYAFAYSIRMRLLPEGCNINGMLFKSCQLCSRHWIIRANDTVVNDINADGVIGLYPLLRLGEEEFIYESCTPLKSSQGSIEGSFTFVPGSLGDPRGPPFEVRVAPFPLQVPDYIF